MRPSSWLGQEVGTKAERPLTSHSAWPPSPHGPPSCWPPCWPCARPNAPTCAAGSDTPCDRRRGSPFASRTARRSANTRIRPAVRRRARHPHPPRRRTIRRVGRRMVRKRRSLHSSRTTGTRVTGTRTTTLEQKAKRAPAPSTEVDRTGARSKALRPDEAPAPSQTHSASASQHVLVRSVAST